jgi:hypothetical protein
MYPMNIQNDVIGLVLHENCKSKQMTDIIANRNYSAILATLHIWYGPDNPCLAKKNTND